jgi:metal-sulfur cluster biosynthetic enzyme
MIEKMEDLDVHVIAVDLCLFYGIQEIIERQISVAMTFTSPSSPMNDISFESRKKRILSIHSDCEIVVK